MVKREKTAREVEIRGMLMLASTPRGIVSRDEFVREMEKGMRDMAQQVFKTEPKFETLVMSLSEILRSPWCTTITPSPKATLHDEFIYPDVEPAAPRFHNLMHMLNYWDFLTSEQEVDWRAPETVAEDYYAA